MALKTHRMVHIWKFSAFVEIKIEICTFPNWWTAPNVNSNYDQTTVCKVEAVISESINYKRVKVSSIKKFSDCL